jgi:hypothetical protein
MAVDGRVRRKRGNTCLIRLMHLTKNTKRISTPRFVFLGVGNFFYLFFIGNNREQTNQSAEFDFIVVRYRVLIGLWWR